ncbi:hypothetical protein HR060_17235 [Catenovulum sp. SM1970]|uniref:hypothetical protein n=1 Tax=Marinifaba aquimaris TaxID=2741323 RepID=UPI001572B768|nr:hypothetical protein [Marinifaba aquimaris]NTS78590.1 hypothetical protein [Marinifaba aquimaris]
MHKNISPQIVFHSPIHKWALVSCCALPFIAFFYGASSGNISAELVFFFTSWSCSVAATLAAFGGYLAVENGKEKQQINEDEYQHWRARTLIPITLFGIAAIVLTFYYGSFLIVKKENLTITAVPTPELMAQMKQFLNEPNVAHTEVEFNGQEQEITFYTQSLNVPANIDRMVKSKKPFPEFILETGEALEVDYSGKVTSKPIKINDSYYCVRTRKIKRNFDDFSQVNNNFEHKHGIKTFVYNDELLIDEGVYLKYSPKKKKCVGKDRSRSSRVLHREFIFFIEENFKAPHLSTAIDKLSREKRIGFRSWQSLNEL